MTYRTYRAQSVVEAEERAAVEEKRAKERARAIEREERAKQAQYHEMDVAMEHQLAEARERTAQARSERDEIERLATKAADALEQRQRVERRAREILRERDLTSYGGIPVSITPAEGVQVTDSSPSPETLDERCAVAAADIVVYADGSISPPPRLVEGPETAW